MGRIAVIHFSPLELYPPLQNILNVLSAQADGHRILIITTTLPNSKLRCVEVANIDVVRFGASGQGLSQVSRYLNYVLFYVRCLLRLIRFRPQKLLYFETLSSFPAFIYKRFVKKNVDLYIHYHEYTSPEEYHTGPILTKFFHRLEKRLYPIASWISHTNMSRMERFVKDVQLSGSGNLFAMPNYPPKSWYSSPNATIDWPLKVVYVGATGLDTMYLREFAEWVIAQKGKVLWDIYTHNCSSEVKEFLNSLGSTVIQLRGSLNYSELPGRLKDYSVGVILYKGHIPNYILNAPNKLFEYLAVGLQVWFPAVMIGSLPYCSNGTYPEVIPLDFEKLDQIRLEELVSRRGRVERTPGYFCEDAVQPLISKMLT